MNKIYPVYRLRLHSQKIAFLAMILICMVFDMKAQQENTNALLPVVKLSGFVRSDLFFDTRQTISAREGHFLIFPAPQSPDAMGEDLNSKSSYNIVPIHSNLGVGVSGSQIFGAAASGLIEGDFFGQSNSDVNMLRLRHAYIKLSWSKTELLIGQYWHPLFVTGCYPGTASFNTGAPIQPFSRAPQVRLTHNIKSFRFYIAMLSQRDNASNGPEGVSSKYLRDSGFPEIQFSGEYGVRKTHEFLMGAGFGYKRLLPQSKSCKNFKSSETVGGLSANLYLKHIRNKMTFKVEGVYLENGSEFLALSGFAVKDSVDTEKGIVDYAPVRTMSFWGEIHTNGQRLQVGLFSGYTENLGTRDQVIGPVYLTSNAPVKSLFRISPRIIVRSGNFSLAFETEYTSAMYGTADDFSIIQNASRAENIRFLISSVYKF